MVNFNTNNRFLIGISVALLGAAAVIVGAAMVWLGALIGFAIALLIPFCIFVVRDVAEFAGNRRPSAVLPLFFLSLPFYNLFLAWRGDLVWQSVSLGVVLLFFFAQSAPDRQQALDRMKLLLGPVGIVMLLPAISTALAKEANSDTYINWFVFSTAACYWAMACIYCRSIQDVYRLMVILVLGGLLQLPIFIGQMLGWTSHLPGGLLKLSPDPWGGSLYVGGPGVRYPGSFGDVELVAEYLAILFLFGAGILLRAKDRTAKLATIIVLIAIVSMGMMSGTRGFVVMILLGTVILVYATVRGSGHAMGALGTTGAMLAVLLLALGFVLPDAVGAALTSRLTPGQLLQPGNLFNRTLMFSQWLQLVPAMPFWGYGDRMLAVINLASPFSAGVKVVSPHSLYFTVILTYGYVGLFAIGLLILSAAVMLIRTTFGAISYEPAGWILFAVLAAWAADEAKIEFVRQPFYIDHVFVLFGMISAVYGLSRIRSKRAIGSGT